MRLISAIGTWRLRLALLALVCAIASLSAGDAATANHSIDVNFVTQFHHFYTVPPDEAYAVGHILRPLEPTPCARDRRFSLYTLSPRILIDTDRSSNNEFFGLGGVIKGFPTVQIRMAGKRFGRGNRHTCESDKQTFLP